MSDPLPSPSMRVFTAVNLPPDLRNQVSATQACLKKSDARVSWVPTENLHVSLAFIGNIYSQKSNEISNALDEAVLDRDPFEIDVHDLGTFGKKHSPRVIWVAVHNMKPLLELYERIKDLLAAIDVRLEDRAYKPHITLGRVKSNRNKSELLDAIRQNEKCDFGKTTVSSVELMKSTLLPSGATYSILHSACLQKCSTE